MTRDQVIEYAKDWVALMNYKYIRDDQEKHDVLFACLDLAYLRTKDALIAYAKDREKQFAEHDRMLDSIEAALQQEFRNGV